MKKAKAKKEHDVDEDQEIQQLYKLLPELTHDFLFCAFHKQKLAVGKPEPIPDDLKEKYVEKRKKFCPRCYRTYGYSYLLIKKDVIEEENNEEETEKWDFKLLPFDEMKDFLFDLNHYVDKEHVSNLNEPKQEMFRPRQRPRGNYRQRRKKPYKRKKTFRKTRKQT
ncbi:MAG: hypothetical protein ACTSRW_12625 [Candidatus Helarchaeota archaeon]